MSPFGNLPTTGNAAAERDARQRGVTVYPLPLQFNFSYTYNMSSPRRLSRMNNITLIEAVREYVALWDTTTADRTDAYARELMWDNVAQKVGSTSE